jgi:hypothetical protein
MDKKTVEWYRAVYMADGMNAMILELLKQFPDRDKDKINSFIKAIMYGVDVDGKPNDKPLIPNSGDIVGNYDKHRFEQRVYARWINEKMR